MIDTREMARAETREQPTATALSDDQIEALLVADIVPTEPAKIVSQSNQGGLTATVTRTPLGRIVMFSPQGLRREVPARDSKELYKENWRFKCPVCGKADCGGIFGGCAFRPIEAWMRCPIESCGRIFKDRQVKDAPMNIHAAPASGDEITFNAVTDPRDRLMERARRHMLAFHPAEASLYGFFPDGTRQSLYVDRAPTAPLVPMETQRQDAPAETMTLDELVDRYPAPLNPKNPEGYAYVCGLCGTGHKNAFALNKHISGHKADQ